MFRVPANRCSLRIRALPPVLPAASKQSRLRFGQYNVYSHATSSSLMVVAHYGAADEMLGASALDQTASHRAPLRRRLHGGGRRFDAAFSSCARVRRCDAAGAQACEI